MSITKTTRRTAVVTASAALLALLGAVPAARANQHLIIPVAGCTLLGSPAVTSDLAARTTVQSPNSGFLQFVCPIPLPRTATAVKRYSPMVDWSTQGSVSMTVARQTKSGLTANNCGGSTTRGMFTSSNNYQVMGPYTDDLASCSSYNPATDFFLFQGNVGWPASQSVSAGIYQIDVEYCDSTDASGCH